MTNPEVDRQLRMRLALDYPKIPVGKFVVFSPNKDGLRWPDAARGCSYASISQTDHHDHPLWTRIWEHAAVFDTQEEAEAYRSKTVNGHHGKVATIREVIESEFL